MTSVGMEFLPFQNRTLELGLAEKIMSIPGHRERCCILVSQPAAGLTSFLRHVEVELANENCLTVYSNSVRFGPEYLFQSFFVSLSEQMEALSRQMQRPEAFRKFIKETIGGGLSFLIPGGGMLRPATDHLFERIRSSYHSSKNAERFAKLAKGPLKEKAIVFLIDNAQNLQEDSLDLFRETVSNEFRNVRYILGFVNRADKPCEYEELADKICSFGHQIVIENFASPDTFLIEDMLDEVNISHNESLIGQIIENTGCNAYKIIIEIRRNLATKNGDFVTKILPHHKMILRYLIAAAQPIPITTIEKTLSNDPAVYLKSNDEISSAFKHLIDMKLIDELHTKSASNALQLRAEASPIIDEVASDKIALLSASNSLYREVAKAPLANDPDSDFLMALRYKLATSIDRKRASRFANDIVWRALESGSLETARRFLQALVPAQSASNLFEFLTPVIFLIATKEYQDALKFLQNPPMSAWSSIPFVQVLKAIALDRTRNNKAAISLIDTLLRDDLGQEELSVLGAVRIASLMHLGRHSEARRFFQEFQHRPKSASNYGYFLRNSAAAFPANEAIDILITASNNFIDHDDEFGHLTCRVNIGSVKANSRDFNGAYKEFRLCSRKMSNFGVSNIEEVLCNLAYTEIVLGKYKRAIARLDELVKIAMPNVPKLYSLHHLALVNLLADRHEASLAAVRVADDLEGSIMVPVAKIRHVINIGLIKAALGLTPANIHSVKKDLPSPSEPYGSIAREMFEKSKYALENPSKKNIRNEYQPGFLEYWSYDPLVILPKALLPFKTVI